MAEKIVKRVKIEVTDNGTLKRTSKDSQTLNRNMKGLSKQSSNASKNFSKTAQGMQGVLVPAYAEVAARVFALSAAYQALSKAADFRILMQGQAEYAKRTGKDMGKIARQVQKAAKGMLDFSEASSAVALATTSGISSGQLTQMTKAAVDSSTALGRSVSDTMDRLTRGIVKAEPEILDEIGVIIRLDKVYKDYAESIGRSTNELTEGEKATARYTAIVGQLETKFGGIADKVDPNYMRSAAASVLDVIMVASSSIVEALNPIMKFLTKSKTAIVMILAVIVKTLAGKIFPMFDGVGERIAKYPAKLGKSVQSMNVRIKELNKSMLDSVAITKGLGAKINKAMPTKYRGASWKEGAKGSSNLRSMGATIGYAERHVKDGIVTGGALKGKTEKYVKTLRNRYIKLAESAKETHGIIEKNMVRGRIATAGFSKGLMHIKLGFATAAASAAHYFTTTKQLIVDEGLLAGTWAGLQAIQVEWVEAAEAATLYERALKRVGATTGAVAVMTASLGSVISKVFGWLIALTMIVSIGKIILDMFVDFDTPFKRATDAAKELNDELGEQQKLFDQKNDLINFDGAAASFDQAMANATFADNFASSLYESTSKAMKDLSAEMGEMGFWEGTLDWMKSLFGMGSADYQQKALEKTIGLVRSGPGGADIMARMRKDYKVTGTVVADDKNYETKFAQWRLRTNQTARVTATSGTRANFDLTDEGKKAKATITYVNKKLETYFQSKAFTDLATPELKAEARLKMYHKLNKEIETMQKLERARTADLKAANDAFSSLSKSQKKYTDSLLVKTPVHEMAVQQRHLKKVMKEDNILDSTKGLALAEQGRYTGEYNTKQAKTLKGMLAENAKRIKAGEEAKHSQVEVAAAATKAYGSVSEEIDNILGGLEDWDKKDLDMSKNITARYIAQNNLLSYKTFAPKTSSFQQSLLEEDIALVAINDQMDRYKYLLKDINKGRTDYDKTAAESAKLEQARWKVWKEMAPIFLKQSRQEDIYNRNLETTGSAGSITDKYYNREYDVTDNYNRFIEKAKEIGDDAGVYLLALERHIGNLNKEKLHEYRIFGNDYLQSLDKTIVAEEKLKNLRKDLNALKEEDKGLYEDILAAQEKALKFNTLKDSNLDRTSMLTNKSLMKSGEALYEEEYRQKFYTKTGGVAGWKKLADLQLKLEKIKADNLNKAEANLEIEQVLRKEYMLALEAERDAIWKERAQIFGGAMNTIANSFGSAISNYFNDVFMNKKPEEGAFRNTLAQGFAGAASKMIGDSYQKTVFGNQGILAAAGRSLGVDNKWLDTIFPQTQLELAQQTVANLQTLIDLEIAGGKGLPGTIGSSANPYSKITDMFFDKILGGAKSGMSSAGGWIDTLLGMFFAKGGVAPGGFRAFAHGGIANKPTLGMIGEGKYNEAVVPLPDGKSIPVKGAGSNNNVTVNVAIDSNGRSKAETDGGGNAKELGYLVSQAVQSELVEQQRPGGLLSAY